MERVLAGCVLALGMLQCAATFLLFSRLEEPALWFLAGGILLSLVGALNILRLRFGAVVPAIGWLAVCASVAVAFLWIAMAWVLAARFKRYPAAYGALALIVTSAAMSLRSVRRTGRA